MSKAFHHLHRSQQWRILHNLRNRNRADVGGNERQEVLPDNVEPDQPAEVNIEGNGRLQDHEERPHSPIDIDEDGDSSSEESGEEDDPSDSEEDELSDHDADGRINEESAEDTGSDNQEGNDFNFFELGGRNNVPLYHGAPLSVVESMCLIMTLVLKHNLSGTCIEDVLTVINMHCIQRDFKSLSLFKYNKFFSHVQNPAIKHYYCSSCCKQLETAAHRCPCAKGVSYFLQFPLIPQLNQLFRRDNFIDSLQHRFRREQPDAGCLSDIYDGELYQRLVADGFLASPHSISFLWNSDGAPVFKSKKYSIWPFYLAINELPYKERFQRKNVLMAGLWFGPKKPKSNLFIKSFKSDFQKLHRGVNVNVQGHDDPIRVKAVLLLGTCDLPAKCCFLNMMQFNGECGCPNCETEGTQVVLPGRMQRNGRIRNSQLRVYNYERDFIQRTSERCQAQGQRAFETGEVQEGVKGPTILNNLMPDFIAGMGIDAMHNVSGIMKKILKLWFDSKYSHEPFSMRHVMPVVDQLLLSLKPPKYIHRMPRSVEELCHWKASELLVWLYYYAPIVLKDIMRPNLYSHFMKLVCGLSLLNCSNVSNDMINDADRLMHSFMEDYERIYGLRHCTINVHLLLHLAAQVRMLGPLWTCSCFHFENLNCLLLRGLHGTTNIDSQLARHHWQVLASARFMDALPDGLIRDFCMIQKKKFKVLSRLGQSCYAVGCYYDLPPQHELIYGALNDAGIEYRHVVKYSRFFKKNMMYVSLMYGRDFQTDSTCCMYMSNNVKCPGKIMCFVKVCRNCDPDIECACQGNHFAILKQIRLCERFHQELGGANPLQYIFRCQLTQHLIAVPIADLKCVCFCMLVGGQMYLAQPDHIKDLV